MTEALIAKVNHCYSSAVEVTANGVRLPDIPAIAAMLSNWNVENAAEMNLRLGALGIGSFSPDRETQLEVYWGFGGVYAHQLFPGDSSPIVPVTNLKDICLRARPDQTVTIWFSYWQ
jgi:hypothetical protein